MEEISKEQARELLRELRKKEPPVELEEFLIELHLAMRIFFEGTIKRDGKTITLKIPNKQKFRITAELVE